MWYCKLDDSLQKISLGQLCPWSWCFTCVVHMSFLCHFVIGVFVTWMMWDDPEHDKRMQYFLPPFVTYLMFGLQWISLVWAYTDVTDAAQHKVAQTLKTIAKDHNSD